MIRKEERGKGLWSGALLVRARPIRVDPGVVWVSLLRQDQCDAVDSLSSVLGKVLLYSGERNLSAIGVVLAVPVNLPTRLRERVEELHV